MATASEPDRESRRRDAGFAIDARFESSRMTFALRGELDLAAAPSLEQRIQSLVWGQLEELVFDLADLAFIDSTGLSLLIKTAQRAATVGVRFSVIRVPDQAMKVFTITGMTDRLHVVPSR